MKIAVDVMGLDSHILECLIGCEIFWHKYPDVEIILVGNLFKYKKRAEYKFEIIHTKEYVNKTNYNLQYSDLKNESIKICVDLLQDNKVDAIISCCNYNVFASCLYSTNNLLPNVNKIGFLSTFPNLIGTFNILDIGNWKNINEQDLFNFAFITNELFFYFVKPVFTEFPIFQIMNIYEQNNELVNYLNDANNFFNNHKNVFNYNGFTKPKELLSSLSNVIFSDSVSAAESISFVSKELAFSNLENKIEFFQTRNFWDSFFNTRNKQKSNVDKINLRKNSGSLVIGTKYPVYKLNTKITKRKMLSVLMKIYDLIADKCFKKIEKKYAKFK